MEVQALLKYIDDLVFAQTGKHLDSLQVVIIKGVLNRQKYTEIAEEYNCSAGHCKDQAYELWRILSEALGEDLKKSNFRATIERLVCANSQYQIIENSVIGNINLCSNTPSNHDTENIESIIQEHNNINLSNKNMEIFKRQIQQAKLENVPGLIELGLTSEQIARALELPIEEVKKIAFLD